MFHQDWLKKGGEFHLKESQIMDFDTLVDGQKTFVHCTLSMCFHQRSSIDLIVNHLESTSSNAILVVYGISKRRQLIVYMVFYWNNSNC